MIATARWRGWLAACVETIDALVFPWSCPLCEAAVESRASPFCEACGLELREAAGSTCARCAMPVGPWADRRRGCSECRRRSLGFDAAVALGPYSGPIRDLCLRMKYESNAWLARWVAELLADSRDEALRGPGIDLVVPVPLHWWKQWLRGYNQADALAIGLARRLGLRVARPLQRVRSTEALAGLGRVERARQMRDAFRARPRSRKVLEGRGVLLVDDILTTGATCGAAARALKAAGAARVVVAVVGRAEGKR